MNISEINCRVAELERSVARLASLQKNFTEAGADADTINALNDGIKYTKMRLEEYKTADWVMTKGIFEK